MIKPLCLILVFVVALGTCATQGQTIVPGTPGFCTDRPDKLYCLLPRLFDEANPDPFTPVTAAFASQLTQVPLASPASGIIYVLDPRINVPVRSGQETYGPVLTDRGDTLGRHALFVAFTFQHFSFSSIDGISLGQIPVVFNVCTITGQCAPIGTIDSINLTVNQYAFFATYGLANRVDVSVAVPLINVNMGAAGVSCTICDGPIDYSVPPNGVQYDFRPQSKSQGALGLGDVVFRVKGQVLRHGKYKIALGGDFRVATGDALNFLGAGAVGVRPFVAFSRGGHISPHLNVGYQWNGDSILGGEVAGTKGKLPDNLFYSAGFDAALHSKLTLAGDFLGEHVVGQFRLKRIVTDNVPDVSVVKGNFNTAKASVGLKYNPVKNMIISGNVLLRLDHNGLRNKPVPLIGVSYTFN
jgi:hypothetical protein